MHPRSCFRFLFALCLAAVGAACGSPAAQPTATAIPATAVSATPASLPTEIPLSPTPTLIPVRTPDMSYLAPPVWTSLPRTTVELGDVTVALETWWAASPDGRWIARGVREELSPSCVYLTNLTLMMADGGLKWTVWDDRQNCGLGSTNPRPFHWSRDGKYLYFTNEPIVDGCGPFVNGSDLYRADLATMLVEQIAPSAGLALSLSPDETQLAYIAFGQRGLVLRSLDSDAELETQLFQQGETAGNIVWSPEGTSLMLTVAPGGSCDVSYSIRRVDLGPLTQTTLIEQDARGFETVAWPEPDRVLIRDREGGYWWMDPATGGLRQAA